MKSVIEDNKIKRILNLLIGNLSHTFLVISGILIVLMALGATYGSIRRYAFNSPEPYSYELSSMFLLLSFVLAVAAVEKQNRFIRCDLLTRLFSENINTIILNIISPILGLLFFGVVIWQSWGDAWYAFQIGQTSSSSWPVPLFPIKIIIPIGYTLLCLVLAGRLYLGLASLKDMITRKRK